MRAKRARSLHQLAYRMYDPNLPQFTVKRIYRQLKKLHNRKWQLS